MSNLILAILILLITFFIIKLLIAFSVISVLSITQGAMFHPSAFVRVKTFLDSTPMRPGELLVDIGCGDGRVLSEAWKRYGVKAVGYEVNLLAYLIARLRNFFAIGVKVSLKNFWEADLSAADIVYCYLFPDVMERLAHKLERELRPGSRVVSCNFRLPGWTHETELNPDSFFHSGPIYIYHFPNSCRQSLS